MADNIIKTGLNTGSTIYNSNGGTLISGDAVKGGYFVTDTLDNIPSWTNVTGALCYCTEDNKYYQYDGIAWVEAKLGGVETVYVQSNYDMGENNRLYTSTTGVYDLEVSCYSVLSDDHHFSVPFRVILLYTDVKRVSNYVQVEWLDGEHMTAGKCNVWVEYNQGVFTAKTDDDDHLHVTLGGVLFIPITTILDSNVI